MAARDSETGGRPVTGYLEEFSQEVDPLLEDGFSPETYRFFYDGEELGEIGERVNFRQVRTHILGSLLASGRNLHGNGLEEDLRIDLVLERQSPVEDDRFDSPRVKVSYHGGGEYEVDVLCDHKYGDVGEEVRELLS